MDIRSNYVPTLPLQFIHDIMAKLPANACYKCFHTLTL